MPSSQRGIMWIGTYNNPPVDLLQDYLEKWQKQAGAVYVTGQLEKGEEGTVHLQYFIQFQHQDKKTLGSLKKHCGRSHFELVKKNNGADTYCNKEDTRLEGPWTFGIKPARKDLKGDTARRNKELIEMGTLKAVEEGYIPAEKALQLERALSMLKLLATKAYEHDDVRGEWHYGVSGAGKSHAVRTKYPDAYIKEQNKWFDGYQGEETILIEDLDGDHLHHYLKIWADKYSCKGEAKGY